MVRRGMENVVGAQNVNLLLLVTILILAQISLVTMSVNVVPGYVFADMWTNDK